MNEQYPYAPAPGKTDTSEAAADSIAGEKHSRLTRAAILAIKEAGEAGMTADECARAADCSVLGMRPRIAELKAQGLIVDSGARRPSINGRQSIVWTIAKPPPLESGFDDPTQPLPAPARTAREWVELALKNWNDYDGSDWPACMTDEDAYELADMHDAQKDRADRAEAAYNHAREVAHENWLLAQRDRADRAEASRDDHRAAVGRLKTQVSTLVQERDALRATVTMNTEYTDEPVCPHCGAVQRDAWEWGDDETGEVTCGSCEREFSYTRHVSVAYSTRKEIECPDCHGYGRKIGPVTTREPCPTCEGRRRVANDHPSK